LRDRVAAADEAEELLALVGGEPQRMIVNFHLLFNVALALLLLGATAPLARLCEAILPGRNTGDSQVTPRHLDPPRCPRRRWRCPTPRARCCASAIASNKCSTTCCACCGPTI
jgi:hypothetical protein